MKYFTNLFVFLAWYLDKISDINATNITQKERIQKLRLSLRWYSDMFEKPHVMIILEKIVLILNESKMCTVKYSEDSFKISNIGETHMHYPTSIAKAPDGAFDVPSVTVTSFGRITQIDVSDPLKPRIASDIRNGSRNDRYISHVWINKNEFFAVDYDVLLHFGNRINGETKEWNSKRVSSGKLFDIVLFQYDPKSFVLYARATPPNTELPKLVIMWAEDAEGKPGDWRNEDHIRKEYIKYDTYSIISADLNNDGKTELIVSTEFVDQYTCDPAGDLNPPCRHVELKVLEIPQSDEIKNPDKYKEHVLIRFDYGHYAVCYMRLKPFIPFVSYKGKPWLYLAPYACCKAFYLQPLNDEVGDWRYKKTAFIVARGDSQIIDVEDLNQDGYADFIQLGIYLNVFSFSNGKITVTTPLVESNISSTPSSSSILYLDSTLLMFIGLVFPLRLL